MNIIDSQTEIKIHGFNPVEEIYLPDKSASEFLNFIEDLELHNKKFLLGPSTQEEVKANAQAFFNRHFKLHKVPIKGDLRHNFDVFLLKHLPSTEIPLRIQSISRYVHPFDIPVRFCTNNMTENMVVENAITSSNEELLRRSFISYKEILLSSKLTELSDNAYIHELTHTQLSHQKGIIRDYFNSEMLSIFMELLNSFYSSKQESLLPLTEAVLLTEMYYWLENLEKIRDGLTNVDEESKIEASKYAISIIKAFNLFIEYYYGTPALKKYILTTIQNIFDGNLQLEELLDEFEITTSSSFQSQTLKKYLSR